MRLLCVLTCGRVTIVGEVAGAARCCRPVSDYSKLYLYFFLQSPEPSSLVARHVQSNGKCPNIEGLGPRLASPVREAPAILSIFL